VKLVRLVGIAAVLGGCGGTASPEGVDGAVAYDAAPDAATGCQPEFGRTFINDTVVLLPENEGHDLDGDGQPDNAVGVFADLFNAGLVDGIVSGQVTALWDFLGLAPPGEPSPDLRLVFYDGLDADVPPDPSNNVGGAGRFLVSVQQFDLACRSLSEWDSALLEGQVATAHTRRWSFVAPSVGTVEMQDVSLVVTFNEDFSGFTAEAWGVWAACALALTGFPGSARGTLLDLLVSGFQRGPDIDVDGDGLELISGDGMTVTQCVDGNGVVITGRDCACDSRIVDGYSFALRGTAVPAAIVGVAAE